MRKFTGNTGSQGVDHHAGWPLTGLAMSRSADVPANVGHADRQMGRRTDRQANERTDVA
jgi:hypothetical protein